MKHLYHRLRKIFKMFTRKLQINLKKRYNINIYYFIYLLFIKN